VRPFVEKLGIGARYSTNVMRKYKLIIPEEAVAEPFLPTLIDFLAFWQKCEQEYGWCGW
jgi:hypothetical protein